MLIRFNKVIVTGLILATSVSVAETNGPAACHIVYDAGSSGTRLYIYEQQDKAWLEHEGPKVSALADPVREIRGKHWKDAESVTIEVVSALDSIKQDGPVKGDKPAWKAFDWTKHCQIKSAGVYATAGMRLAEQANKERSVTLWASLKQKLAAKLGPTVDIEARTLTGYEEGLYAWLAVREQQPDDSFAIAEMGGASAQITFPCAKCDENDPDTKTVQLSGKHLQIYSYSFLGLGQDEASHSLGFPTSCANGIGTQQSGWKAQDCANQIQLTGSKGIRDPYDFDGEQRGAHEQPPIAQADSNRWFLTGAFNYMNASNIETYCLKDPKLSEEESFCFRSIYPEKYLETLKIPVNSPKMNVSWTQGAVICKANSCLEAATKTPPLCRWLDKGCLP
ncbi:MAG: hypothetical protein BWK79_10920 [Beggiatoa sp. IS2]|nr:MAG: hypothetical protein BWK79_10920 [Beggiatoa sp. IS2]